MTSASSYGVEAGCEHIIAVADLALQRKTWLDLAGYDVVSDDEDGLLITCPSGVTGGRMRFIEVSADTPLIRPTDVRYAGGIYDMDLRVRDIEAAYEKLTAIGWRVLSDYVTYTMGPVHVHEGLLECDDGIVLALMQRLDPPLDFDPGFISEPFNSAQIVDPKDLDEVMAFYRDTLGFPQFLDTTITWQDTAGKNLFGMDPASATDHPAAVTAFGPSGSFGGSVEPVAIEGYSVQKLEMAPLTTCQPHARGIIAYRYRVKDIEGYKNRVGSVASAIGEKHISSMGNVKYFSVTSPNGCVLEFVEDK